MEPTWTDSTQTALADITVSVLLGVPLTPAPLSICLNRFKRLGPSGTSSRSLNLGPGNRQPYPAIHMCHNMHFHTHFSNNAEAENAPRNSRRHAPLQLKGVP